MCVFFYPLYLFSMEFGCISFYTSSPNRPDAVQCILNNTEVNANAVALSKTALYSACWALRLVPAQRGRDTSLWYESVLRRDSIRCV
jgi:hypothetical protein